MVKYKLTILTACLVLLALNPLSARLVVNEVMSNEPGSNTSLEWFELYNTDYEDTVSLALYAVYADGTQLNFQTGAFRRDSFLVVCQNLTAFESVWGDNSGVWGDAENEDYPLIDATASFSLNNESGIVGLYLASNLVSSLSWTSAGEDGVSWERIHPDSTNAYQSIDPSGSTPGRLNSITPRDYDLALLSAVSAPTGDGQTELIFRIANVGLEVMIEDSLFLFKNDDLDSTAGRADLIAVAALPDINPGDTITETLTLEFDGFYINLLARLFGDDNNNNNLQLFSAPGVDYPPIVISEFLADPTPSFRNEWVELKNRSDVEINVANWYLGDESVLYPITGEDYFMEPDEYIVLCRDLTEFESFYDFIDYTVIEPTGWPSLNNDVDVIRLVDNYGITVDSIAYDSTFGNNYTWARGEEIGYTNSWGRSADSGGTPGAANVVNFPATGSTISITAEPNPFSLSRHREMSITFSLPPGTFNMKLYDIEGRIVKTFVNDHYAYEGSIIWDGSSDGGRPLPVGIYILYAEVVDVEQYKQTIVIAP